MCWLYGRVTEQAEQVSNDNLRKFFSKGGDINPHGWGLASYSANEKDFSIVKEPVNASNSMVAHAVAVQSGFAKTQSVVAHVRYMTTGTQSYRDTQPMVKTSLVRGDRWVFAHNGSAPAGSLAELAKDVGENCEYEREWKVDSELLFIEFLDCIDRIMVDRKSENFQTFRVIKELFGTLNTHTKMCVIATNGDLTFAYRDKDGQRALSILQEKKGHTICTKELSGTGWVSFAHGQLVVLRKGKLIYNSCSFVKNKSKPTPAKVIQLPSATKYPYNVVPARYSFPEFPKDEYLMGRDNFIDCAEEMGVWDDLDNETRSDERRDYGDFSVEDLEDGHDYGITTIGEYTAQQIERNRG